MPVFNYERSGFKLDKITAAIINTHPKISFGSIVSPKITAPPSTAKTDSRLKIIDAITGRVFFCPKICNV